MFAGKVLGGPAMVGNNLTQSRGVLQMERFHAGDIRATKEAGIEQFLADPQVLFPHGDEFGLQFRIQHIGDYAREYS